MSRVFVVTSGEYSDYSIEGVFSTVSLANEFISMIEGNGRNYLRIENFDLDKPLTQLKRGLHSYVVLMDKDGTVQRVYKATVPSARTPFYTLRPLIGDEKYILDCYVWARSDEHAVKQTNDCRARIVAEDVWIEWSDDVNYASDWVEADSVSGIINKLHERKASEN